MPPKYLPPNATNLYSNRDRIDPKRLDTALAEARDLARWAGRRISNGPTSGFLTEGYVIGHTGDLDLAVAMIVARVRSETLGDFITRNSVQHTMRLAPGAVAHGTLRDADEYNTPGMVPLAHVAALKPIKNADYATRGHREMAPESKLERNRRQLAVRRTGKCDGCGAEFVSDKPGLRAGPAQRTPKQWREAFKRGAQDVPLMKPLASITYLRKSAAHDGARKTLGRHAEEGIDYDIRVVRPTLAGADSRYEWVPRDVMFPGGHNLSGFGSEPRPKKVLPRKEKIPNHKGSPTGALRGPSKGKRK